MPYKKIYRPSVEELTSKVKKGVILETGKPVQYRNMDVRKSDIPTHTDIDTVWEEICFTANHSDLGSYQHDEI